MDSRLYCYQSSLPCENRCLGSQRGWEQHLYILYIRRRKISQRWNQSYMSIRLLKMPAMLSAHLTGLHLVQFTKIHRFKCLLCYYLSHSVHSMTDYITEDITRLFNVCILREQHALNFGGIHSLSLDTWTFYAQNYLKWQPKSYCFCFSYLWFIYKIQTVCYYFMTWNTAVTQKPHRNPASCSATLPSSLQPFHHS